MENRKTIKGPPLILTVDHPIDIIGRENMDTFTKYIRIYFTPTSSGNLEKRLDKEIGSEDRQAIAQTLKELRKNGFIPLGVNKHGCVIWDVITKSKQQELLEEGLDELRQLSIPELQRIGRSGYKKVIEKVKVQPAEDYEINRE